MVQISSCQRGRSVCLYRKIYFILVLILILSSLISCIEPEITFPADNTHIIIWDPEKNIADYKTLTDSLQERFVHTVILSEYLPDTAAVFLKSEFSAIPDDALCIFILISSRLNFHVVSEWNLWFPEMWRDLDCEGKILVADASWGDEFLNPLKTLKEDTVWAIDGKIGRLRRKLPGSMLAASSRCDESNLISRGIDGKTKTPLFSWYFINELCTAGGNSAPVEIVSAIERTVELTQTARNRGIVSDIEEVLFFNRSQVIRDEFRTYPNPVIWNGLAEKVFIGADE